MVAVRPEDAGVGEEVGVGRVVDNGGRVPDTGATRVGSALYTQARLSAAMAESINIRMDGFMADFMDGFIVSFSPWRPQKFGTNFGMFRDQDVRHGHFVPRFVP